MKISYDGMLRRMRHLPQTIDCGLHSGIPRCCIRFYVMDWMFAEEGRDFRRRHQKMMTRWGMALVGYIPCPDCCRHGHRVSVKTCPEGGIHCHHSEEQAL